MRFTNIQEDDDLMSSDALDDGPLTFSQCKQRLSQKLTEAANYMNTPNYELFQNMMTLFNIACIVYLQELQDHSISLMQNWMIFQIILNTIFLVELLSDVFLLGPISAFQLHFRAWPELVCQILNIRTIV